MLSWIFYTWGIINVLLLIIPIFYDRGYLNSRIFDKNNYLKKSAAILQANYSTFIWCAIGLFSSQWAWFLFYFLYIFISRKIIKVDIVNNPTRFNIELSRLMKISILLIVLFPVVNHFFLDINVLNFFIDNLKQCLSLFRI